MLCNHRSGLRDHGFANFHAHSPTDAISDASTHATAHATGHTVWTR